MIIKANNEFKKAQQEAKKKNIMKLEDMEH